jgi:hypothetical protein
VKGRPGMETLFPAVAGRVVRRNGRLYLDPVPPAHRWHAPSSPPLPRMSLLCAVHLGSAMSRRLEGFPGLIYKGRAGAEAVERTGRRVAP